MFMSNKRIELKKQKQRGVYRYIAEMEDTIAAIRDILESGDIDAVKVQRIRQHIHSDTSTTLVLPFSERLYERLVKQAKKEGKRLTELVEGLILNYVTETTPTSAENDHVGEPIVQTYEIQLASPFVEAWKAKVNAEDFGEAELLGRICTAYLRNR